MYNGNNHAQWKQSLKVSEKYYTPSKHGINLNISTWGGGEKEHTKTLI